MENNLKKAIIVAFVKILKQQDEHSERLRKLFECNLDYVGVVKIEEINDSVFGICLRDTTEAKKIHALESLVDDSAYNISVESLFTVLKTTLHFAAVLLELETEITLCTNDIVQVFSQSEAKKLLVATGISVLVPISLEFAKNHPLAQINNSRAINLCVAWSSLLAEIADNAHLPKLPYEAETTCVDYNPIVVCAYAHEHSGAVKVSVPIN